jgi:hypothetical protein
VVSLLARASTRGRDAALWFPAVPLGCLAGAAALAVSLVGLLGVGLALVVVQTLDPAGGLGVGSSIALTGRLWLLAQGGQLSLGSGPLVLAPLLLTLAIDWGLSQAGRGIVRLSDLSTAGQAVRATAVAVLVHVLISVLLARTLDDPDVGVGLWRATAGSLLLGAVAVGWGVGRESGLLGDLLDRLPGPVGPMLRGVLAGLLTAVALCTVVVVVALVSDASGYATLSGSLGGAGAGALGLLGLALLLLPSVPCRPSLCWRRCPTHRPCR